MNLNFTKTKYRLLSVKSGKIFNDAGWTLDAPGETEPTLIRAIYEKKQIDLKDNTWGLYKFNDWLPVSRILKGSSPPVTYRSKGLADSLGLENLWITFSGYWPEQGANMTTCSFKETEAYSVCGRMTEEMNRILVVASAGNTSRSFAKVCSENNIPLLLCVPQDYIDALWFEEPLNDCVRLICSKTGSDYYDAIYLSNIIAGMDGFIAEGGAKNVARRDGMATTVLSAATTIGKIPEYYFQAIGSGTGAIAAWEANLRLIEDGRFGNNKMKLMVSQNAPFNPIYDAWIAKSRSMIPLDNDVARKLVEIIDAKVLSNRKPPYPPAGGLYDAMTDTEGEVLLATNEKLREASEIFERTEGTDIHPAAAVATATLIDSVKSGHISKKSLIMLNVTGGGEKRFKTQKELHFLKPDLIFDLEPDPEVVKNEVKKLFNL